MTIMGVSMAASNHDTGVVDESLHLIHKYKAEKEKKRKRPRIAKSILNSRSYFTVEYPRTQTVVQSNSI